MIVAVRIFMLALIVISAVLVHLGYPEMFAITLGGSFVVLIAYAWANALEHQSAARDAQVFGAAPTFRVPPPVAKLQRDRRLSFHGRVRQQIRTIDLRHGHHERPLRVIKPEDLS